MIVFWLMCGLLAGGFYGWLWARVILPGDTDDASVREWDRRVAEFRKPLR